MNSKRVGVAGHAGIGHVNGYAGFIQDDSGGFATVGALIKEFLNADTRVKKAEVDVDSNFIRITTVDGGTATASPRRGLTPAEARLIEKLRGQDALFYQNVAVTALGRMYGQGVLETPVALEAALANAVIDTFRKNAPGKFIVVEESIEANCGLLGGISAELDEVTVSYLISVNYTAGGLGPVEDMEGNIPLGSKGTLMKELEMVKCPTIIVEGKAYLPSISDTLDRNTFLVRAQEGIDNTVVACALTESAEELSYPVIFRDDLLPRRKGSMAQHTREIAKRIIDCTERLKQADAASVKVAIVAEMAKLVSQDAGAITCISNTIHDVVRGAGMLPGTSAVLSMVVTKMYQHHWKIPLYEREDVEMAKNIITRAIEKIAANYEHAYANLERHYEEWPSDWDL
ncbi:MAG: hypothetical protein AYK19_16430 [Theionarchaea archaeon DG-70-1]|nr:MAG: hypothetical protein AYK19_16430 [Theionarchaea archaeon DG-70-1]